jgi:hypothetical protein
MFRGEFRLQIPLRQIRSIEARSGELHVQYAEAAAVFELGPAAEKWAFKILHPKSLLDRLGVKQGARVAVLGIREASFLRDLAACAAEVSARQPKKDTDVIFFAAEDLDTLKRLGGQRAFLKPDGAVWVVYPKGQKAITENDVLAAIRRAGFVDVKVARFAETHTALKAVIPVKQR